MGATAHNISTHVWFQALFWLMHGLWGLTATTDPGPARPLPRVINQFTIKLINLIF